MRAGFCTRRRSVSRESRLRCELPPSSAPIDATERDRAKQENPALSGEALGWTARDLFGPHKSPEQPGVGYCRLSRALAGVPYSPLLSAAAEREQTVLRCKQRVTSDMNSTGVGRLAPDDRNSARGSEYQTHFLIVHVV